MSRSFEIADGSNPHSEQAEMYVIGGILNRPHKVFSMMDHLEVGEDWFYTSDSNYVIRAILKLRSSNGAIEKASIVNALDEMGFSQFVSDGFMDKCRSTFRSSRSIGHYIGILRSMMIKRVTYSNCEACMEKIRNSKDTSGEDIASGLMAETSKLIAVRASKKKSRASIKSFCARMVNGMHGIPTRWLGLNAYLGGYVKGKFCMVCSRPKIGKSTYMSNDAVYQARNNGAIDGKAVLVVSLEMTYEEVVSKMAAAELGIDLFKYRMGRSSKDEVDMLQAKMLEISDLPLIVIDGGRNIEGLTSILQDYSQECGLAYIDYAQHITPSVGDPKNERERFARHSNRLRDSFGSTGIAGVLFAQLSREAEAKWSKGGMIRRYPGTKDIKGAGNWEEDACAVVNISRHISVPEDLMMDDNQPTRIDLVLNRFGPTGAVNVMFEKSKNRLSEDAVFVEYGAREAYVHEGRSNFGDAF